ncbi:hypothetical protein CCP3SC5AM1_530011 [Gammaproteobacteria bacterium]
MFHNIMGENMFNKIRKIKISSRLLFVGGVILILFAITITIGIITTNYANQKFFFMFEDRYKKVEIINNIDDHASKVAEQFMEIFLIREPSRVDAILNDMHTERNMILEELTELGEITRTERGLKLLANVRNSYAKCPSLETSFMQAIKENRLDKENENQLLFNNIKQHHLQCEMDLKRLLEFQRTRVKEIILEIEYTQHKNVIIIGILSFLVSMIIIAMISWIIFTIKRPVRDISIFVERITQGEIPDPLMESWDGEFDDIRKNINAMCEAIRALYMIDKYAKDSLFPEKTKH